MNQSKESLEQWRNHWIKQTESETTENGKHPHRLNSTGHSLQVRGINEIIDLAKKQCELQLRGGKAAKTLAIQYLRDLVEEIEREQC
jgi:hypothetical protein